MESQKLIHSKKVRIRHSIQSYLMEIFHTIVKNIPRGIPLKDYIEERAISIANYIIDSNATVRQTAKAFGVSKSTVHKEVTKQNGLYGR